MPRNTRLDNLFSEIFSPDFPMTYSRVEEYLSALVDNFSGTLPLVTPFELGHGYWGTKIRGLRLGTRDRSPSVLYVGAHHGMERITAALLLRFAYDYCLSVENSARNYAVQSEILAALRNIYIVPMLNPDGVSISAGEINSDHPMYTRLLAMNGLSPDFSRWQANGRGVDLNHNYDAGFAEYKEVEQKLGIVGPEPTKYSGEFPFSEPETAALRGLIERINPSLCLTLHTQGEEIYYTSGDKVPTGGEAFASWAAAVTGYKKEKPTGTAAYGGMTDWFVEKYDRPSLTVECGLGKNPLPSSDGEGIYKRIRELLFTAPTRG